MKAPPSLSLTDYCLQKHISYPVGLTRVLRGKVRGWKDQNGHWRVAIDETERADERDMPMIAA